MHEPEVELIDFYADWCEPCKWLDPVLAELQLLLGAEVRIKKVNIDTEPQLAHDLHIKSVPTLILFHRNKEIWRMQGFLYAQQLASIIKDQIQIQYEQG